MRKQLTVQNAEIKTAAVEVKALTIKGRQVTLAVFRQLKEKPLVRENGELNGTPWGIVNYHPDRCANAYEHIHVVWQREDELLRASIEAPKSSAKSYALYRAFPALVSYAMTSLEVEKEFSGIRFGRGEADDEVKVTYLDRTATINAYRLLSGSKAWQDAKLVCKAARSIGTDRFDVLDEHDKGRCMHLVEEKVDFGFNEIRFLGPVAGLRSLFDDIDACDARYKKLLELPQLFIAV